MSGKVQMLWSGTYTSSAADFNDKEPWELDAHDYSSQRFSESATLSGFDTLVDNKVKHYRGPLRNTAGTPFEITDNIYGEEITFVFCLKAKGQKEPTRNEQPVLNSSKIRVAGVTLEPYEGLLMPMQCRLVTDEDKNGEERSYYEINVTIRRHPKGWLKYVENVGTMARFKKSDGTLTVAMPIYRYYKWTSKDEVLNLKQPPVLGNIHDVYAARSVYAELLFPGKSNTAEYWNAWQKPPYEEVKEPLYLAADGTIDEAALADASKGLQMRYFIATPASWKQYELPDKKELA